MTKMGESWVVEIREETVWYGGDLSERNALNDKAKADAGKHGCSSVSIFVVPDPLFPLYGETSRHRVWTTRIDRSENDPYSVEALFTGIVKEAVFGKISLAEQQKMITVVRDKLNRMARGQVGRYQIVFDNGKLIERGRV